MTPASRTPTARKIHATLDDHETRLRLVETSRESDSEKLDGIGADVRQLRAAFDELSRDVRNVLMHERDVASTGRKKQPGLIATQARKSLAASVAVIIAALAGGAAAMAQSCGSQAHLQQHPPGISAQK